MNEPAESYPPSFWAGWAGWVFLLCEIKEVARQSVACSSPCLQICQRWPELMRGRHHHHHEASSFKSLGDRSPSGCRGGSFEPYVVLCTFHAQATRKNSSAGIRARQVPIIRSGLGSITWATWLEFDQLRTKILLSHPQRSLEAGSLLQILETSSFDICQMIWVKYCDKAGDLKKEYFTDFSGGVGGQLARGEDWKTVKLFVNQFTSSQSS